MMLDMRHFLTCLVTYFSFPTFANIGCTVLEKLAILNHGSMYKTKPFEAMLEEVFTSRPLFGGANEGSEMITKVAITTTSAVAQHAVVLANYNRPDTEEYGESESFRGNFVSNVYRFAVQVQ